MGSSVPAALAAGLFKTVGTNMIAYFGLGAHEVGLLVFIALMMVIGPVVAVILAMAMMRRYYHIRAGAVGKP